MIFGCFFSPAIARFILRHPALIRAERAFSLATVGALVRMALSAESR
jgi:predicted nicotinamide N-methyase